MNGDVPKGVRAAVINVVGLTGGLIGPEMPRISQFRERGSAASVVPAFPAVTCTAQSNYLTGTTPAQHGIVGNGWYSRELSEVQFWKQSNRLVTGRKIWEALRDGNPAFTCAKLFWWYNMYSSADYTITPRPCYPADGRKVFDIYTAPGSIRGEIQRELGEFPFPAFWGPGAGSGRAPGGADAVSRWIAASAQWVEERYQPNLSLIYLPHLDYNLQRFGPKSSMIAEDLRRIDAIVGDLIGFFEKRGVRVMLLSEYGIGEVDTAVHLNRLFREAGWLAVREELGLELLDCGASRVFAVADHQVAHIYLNDLSLAKAVRELLERQPGVAEVLDLAGKARKGLDHPRAGDLVAVAGERAWFTYYYWLEDRLAPDFARCVDIHRKPGYDPVELFVDPNLRLPMLKVAWRLLQKKLGFRMSMDVIPLDANLVKGSHGLPTSVASAQPVLICDQPGILPKSIDSTQVSQVISGVLRGVSPWPEPSR